MEIWKMVLEKFQERGPWIFRIPWTIHTVMIRMVYLPALNPISSRNRVPGLGSKIITRLHMRVIYTRFCTDYGYQC